MLVKQEEDFQYIKQNNLFNEFYSFCYYVISVLNLKKISNPIYVSYLDLALQQSTYFGSVDKVVIGIQSNGTLITKKDPLPYIDYIIREVVKKNKNNPSFNQVVKAFHKFNYKIKSPEDINIFRAKDEMFSNLSFRMAPFINEKTIDMFPEPMFYPLTGISRLRVWKDTSFYKEVLTKRRYQLPQNGVVGTYYNSKDIHMIKFKEIYQYERVILLYRLYNSQMESVHGYYDTKTQLFYSVFKDTTGEAMFHYSLENFILENYCHLTTDMEIDSNIDEALFVFELHPEEELGFLKEPLFNQISVLFEYENINKDLNKGTNKKRTFNKKNYSQDEVSISPFIRKLPIGAIASDEAIKAAKELGYLLLDGETFVKPHTRTTYQKK